LSIQVTHGWSRCPAGALHALVDTTLAALAPGHNDDVVMLGIRIPSVTATLEAAIAAFQAESGAQWRPADRKTERDGPV